MHHRSTLLLAFLTSLQLAACGDDGGGSTSDATTAATPATTTDPTTGPTTDTPGTTEQGTTEAGTTGAGTTEPDTSTGPDPTTTTDPGTTGPGTTSSATDTDGTTGLLGPSWAVDVYPVLNPPVNCDCHTPGSGGLMMGDPATAYMNLVGVASTQSPLNRIEPGDTDASYLWHKINGTQMDVGGSGSKMPLGGLPVLPQETFDIIDAWIAGGAQP